MNILQMDMNLLKVLYLLTCTGSSQKTADKLGISTSAVSHALARLREVLDEPLFRREGHRQVPTLFALSLKEKLAPLFSSLDGELFGHVQDAPRNFTLVAPPALHPILLPLLAQKSTLINADIRCQNFERRSWRNELLEGSIDMVIAVGDHQQRTSALCYELIGCTRLVAVFGPPLQPVLQHKSGLTFSELADYAHYYCHPWPQAENELDRQLERQGLQRRIQLSCADYAQLPPVLRAAPLMAVVPQPWFRAQPDKQRLFTLPILDNLAIGHLFSHYRQGEVEWKKRLISTLHTQLRPYYQ
ncbi:LysR family transcriptional regulator [Serratia proteamaculans]|uniref:LysR family transcriptional regulator n=1 Tax=Serratia proteamaculans TaxID=28151 RepID=UPI002178173A|nr:LysR family transcriptional regulator [Serratia proteamaculans]CAI1843026.1 Nodulation protein D 2 [Serratia proteamaculans]CAI2405258.1 Nodulation protein D 2 [Serratia proteamaculans]